MKFLSIQENIKKIKDQIPSSVKLLAVSKTKPLEELEEAYKAGIRDFGENKVQELIEKEERFHDDIRWHLIGKLQRNKVKYIVGKVYLIHSLSSIKLLKEIEKNFSKKDEIANVLIQINIGKEESKSGFSEEEVEDVIKELEICQNVKAKGIMVIIPNGTKEENSYYFRKTNNIYEKLKSRRFENITMEILSMGMTNDYKEAIEEGSNLIRVGSAIFGKRDYEFK